MENNNNGLNFNEEIKDISAKKEVRRAEKAHKKAEKYKAKAAAHRDAERRKSEKKERREQVRSERKRLKAEAAKNGRGKKGYVATIIALSLATVTLASVLTVTFLTPSSADATLETGYRKSFYDTVAQVDNIDVNLSKVLATKDESAAQLYLLDLAVNSELAENDIQQLPLEDESKFYTAKVINQVGDFAKYLNKKIVTGEGISGKDRENLKVLYKATAALKDTLQSTMKNMGDGYAFADMGKKFKGNDLLDRFNRLQELSVEYPELIYDGPFSDGRDNAEMKGLTGAEISQAQAEKVFTCIFGDYEISDIRSDGKTQGSGKSLKEQADALKGPADQFIRFIAEGWNRKETLEIINGELLSGRWRVKHGGRDEDRVEGLSRRKAAHRLAILSGFKFNRSTGSYE